MSGKYSNVNNHRLPASFPFKNKMVSHTKKTISSFSLQLKIILQVPFLGITIMLWYSAKVLCLLSVLSHKMLKICVGNERNVINFYRIIKDILKWFLPLPKGAKGDRRDCRCIVVRRTVQCVLQERGQYFLLPLFWNQLTALYPYCFHTSAHVGLIKTLTNS